MSRRVAGQYYRGCAGADFRGAVYRQAARFGFNVTERVVDGQPCLEVDIPDGHPLLREEVLDVRETACPIE